MEKDSVFTRAKDLEWLVKDLNTILTAVGLSKRENEVSEKVSS